MLYGGIDIGAQSVKAVIFDGQKIIGNRSTVTEKEADKAAKEVFEDLLTYLHCRPEDVDRVFATGCGAGEVSFADKKSSEQICAARGARWLIPTARTVVDLGAEGCRAMKLGPEGEMEDFANNAKCASGTGSSIELGAVYLKVPVDQMGPLSITADGVAEISSTCAVFAESVIISHIHRGESRARIAAGIHRAVATRVIELIGRIGLVEDVVIVGGAGMNSGLVKTLQEMTGASFRVPKNPRTSVALGAAIQASLKKDGRRNRKSLHR